MLSLLCSGILDVDCFKGSNPSVVHLPLPLPIITLYFFCILAGMLFGS